MIDSNRLLTLADVAHYLNVSKRTAYRYATEGNLKAVKVGGEWRIKNQDLIHFIEGGAE